MRRQTSRAKAFASGQSSLARPSVERRDHMQALAAGGLAEADEARGLEPLAHFLRRLDHRVERHVRRRDRDRTQGARAPRACRGWQFQGCSSTPADLRDRGQALDAIDLRDRACGRRRRSTSSSRLEVPGMAWRWKNCSPAMPSGARMIEQGRPLICAHHPRPDRFEIAREVELGDRLAVAGVRPQRLVADGRSTTPITTEAARLARVAAGGVLLRWRSARRSGVAAAGAGVFASTSSAACPRAGP